MGIKNLPSFRHTEAELSEQMRNLCVRTKRSSSLQVRHFHALVCHAFRDDRLACCHETRYMETESLTPSNVVGRRMRSRREALQWSQEKVGVLIGIDESSSRARISRYELGTHEPPVKTARQIANVLGVPLAYLYCDDDELAKLILALSMLKPTHRKETVSTLLLGMAQQ